MQTAAYLRLTGDSAWRCASAQASSWRLLPVKDALLLARLALNGPQLRTALALWLWPAAPPPRANANLRQRLFRLRQLEPQLVLEDGQRLLLAPGVAVEGSVSFAEANSGAETSLMSFDPALPLLASVDAQLLDNLQLEWLDQTRQAWRTRCIDQLTRHAHQLLAAGALAAALGSAEQLVLLEPLHEHGWRLLMRVHHQRGDRAAAIAAFERCEEVLRTELGIRPGPETLVLLAECEAVSSSSLAPALAPHRGPLPPALLRPPQRVGRDATLAHMAAAWQAGRPFMLVGSAGLGKSRLLADFAEQTSPTGRSPSRTWIPSPGGAVVVVAARPGDQNRAFGLVTRLLRQALLQAAALNGVLQEPAGPAVGPWLAHAVDPALHQELARWLPELAPAPAAPAQAAVLQATLDGVHKALAKAGLHGVIIDDWQHADVASQEALWPLLLGGGPLCWGLASRPGTPPPPSTAASSARLETLLLDRLSDGDTSALLTSLGTLPGLPQLDEATPPSLAHPAERSFLQRLVRHSGGNPLFLLETLKLLVLQPGLAQVQRWPVPSSVQAVLDSRLETLSASALALARLVALAEADLNAETVARCLDVDVQAVAQLTVELQRAQIMGPASGGVGFQMAHEVVRDAVLAAWPQALHTASHARLAQALHAQGSEPASVARHAELAGDLELTASAAQLAADAARQLGRAPERLVYLQKASSAFARAGQAQAAFRAQLQTVEPLLAIHGSQAALDACARLADEMATQPAALCQVELVRAEVALNGYRPEEAEQAARAALLGLQPLDPLEPTARSHSRPQATSGTTDDSLLALRAHLLLGAALAMLGQPAQALATIEPWHGALEAVDQALLAATLWSQWALVQHAAGQLTACEAALQRQRQYARKAADVGTEAQALSSLAGIRILLGDADACVALAQRAGDLHRRMGEPHSALLADFNRAIALIGCDRFGAADRVLNEAQALAPCAGDSQLPIIANELRAEWLLRLHRPQQALACMQAEPPASATPLRHLNRALIQALAWQQQDDAARARTAWQAVDEIAQDSGPVHGVAVQFRALVLSSVAQPTADAQRRLEGLLTLAQASSSPPAQALVRMHRAALALRLRDVTQARRDAEWLLAHRKGLRHLYVSTAELLALVHRVFAAAGDAKSADLAAQLVHDAQRWFVDELQPNLPTGSAEAWRSHPAHASLFLLMASQ